MSIIDNRTLYDTEDLRRAWAEANRIAVMALRFATWRYAEVARLVVTYSSSRLPCGHNRDDGIMILAIPRPRLSMWTSDIQQLALAAAEDNQVMTLPRWVTARVMTQMTSRWRDSGDKWSTYVDDIEAVDIRFPVSIMQNEGA